MNVLVVEDEKKIASFIKRGLKEQNFNVDVLHNGDEAYERILAHPYDIIVMDIMIPGKDGLSILKNIRKQHINTPVLLLTARSELDDRIEGLNLGADDYLTKPFFVEELIARIHAIIRRDSGDSVSVLKAEDVSVNLLTREVSRGDRKIALSTREFDLLAYLIRSPGRVYTRTQILEHVWSYDFDPNTNLVDVHIQRLRKKLNAGDAPDLIETVRGVGYRVKAVGQP